MQDQAPDRASLDIFQIHRFFRYRHDVVPAEDPLPHRHHDQIVLLVRHHGSADSAGGRLILGNADEFDDRLCQLGCGRRRRDRVLRIGRSHTMFRRHRIEAERISFREAGGRRVREALAETSGLCLNLGG